MLWTSENELQPSAASIFTTWSMGKNRKNIVKTLLLIVLLLSVAACQTHKMVPSVAVWPIQSQSDRFKHALFHAATRFQSRKIRNSCINPQQHACSTIFTICDCPGNCIGPFKQASKLDSQDQSKQSMDRTATPWSHVQARPSGPYIVDLRLHFRRRDINSLRWLRWDSTCRCFAAYSKPLIQ